MAESGTNAQQSRGSAQNGGVGFREGIQLNAFIKDYGGL
jgi:hypothetical protein